MHLYPNHIQISCLITIIHPPFSATKNIQVTYPYTLLNYHKTVLLRSPQHSHSLAPKLSYSKISEALSTFSMLIDLIYMLSFGGPPVPHLPFFIMASEGCPAIHCAV